MSEKCPACLTYDMIESEDEIAVCDSPKCFFMCNREDLPRIAAAMELARATRTLEDAMEPLNSGKLKMGEALPRIKLAMADQKACEQRALELFGGE